MSKRMTTNVSPDDQLPSALNEVAPAIRDVTNRLTHDLSDTPDDLRDTIAFAPLAAVKLVQEGVNFLSARPGRTLMVVTTLAAIVMGIAVARRKPQTAR